MYRMLPPDFVLDNLERLHDDCNLDRGELALQTGLARGTIRGYLVNPENVTRTPYNKIAAVMGWQKWEKP